jgi:hypothetical protein
MGNSNKVTTLIRYTKKINISDADKSLSRMRQEAKVRDYLWSEGGCFLKIWNGFEYVERMFDIKELSKVRAAYYYQDTKTLVLEIF